MPLIAITALLAWVETRPFFALINALIVVIIGVVAIAATRSVRRSLVVVLIAVIVSACWWGIQIINTNVEETIAIAMRWEIDPEHNRHPYVKQKHIQFYFPRNLNHYVGMYSDQVASYLETLPSDTVHVRFEVTKSFGRITAFSLTRIGTLTGWDEEMSYGYTGGPNISSGPSPWP